MSFTLKFHLSRRLQDVQVFTAGARENGRPRRPGDIKIYLQQWQEKMVQISQKPFSQVEH